MKGLISIILLGFATYSYSASKMDLIVIKPVVTVMDSIPKFKSDIKLFPGTFKDTTSSKDNGILGNTRVGINKTAPIVVKPSLLESFRSSFQSLLESRGNYVNDASIANYVIDITITECTIEEKTSGLSQTMTAIMKVEVKLTQPLDASKVKIFTVEGQNATTSMDTSRFAERTMRDTFINIMSEIVKVINKS